MSVTIKYEQAYKKEQKDQKKLALMNIVIFIDSNRSHSHKQNGEIYNE